MRAAVAAWVTLAVGIAGAQQAMFKSGVGAVALYAVVTDRDGRFVSDLSRDDFRVLDNGKPVEISLFSNEVQPATLNLLLDLSESTVGKVVRIREAATAFVDALRPGDRMRIGTFGAEIGMSPLLTDDHALLRRVLNEELWPGGATPLWNAIDAGMHSLGSEPGRRVIVTLTDGANSASLPGWDGTLAGVQRRALDDDFMLYAIGMEGSGLEKPMVDLTNNTGGAHFELKKDQDVSAAFTKVADELRHQYLIGFVPASTDGRAHTLDVRVTRPGMKVRARKSYLQVDRPARGGEMPADPLVPRWRAGRPLQEMQVRVRDLDGRPIEGLIADDFQVTEGGAPLAIDSVVSGKAVSTIIVQDADMPQYGPSPIWDAVDRAISDIENAPAPRSVVLVSDGRASGNRLGSADVTEHALAMGVPVSSIISAPSQSFQLTATTMLLVRPELLPQQVAETTAGIYLPGTGAQPRPPAALLDEIASEIGHSYVIRFATPADGLRHRVSITVRRAGATVVAPATYVAARRSDR